LNAPKTPVRVHSLNIACCIVIFMLNPRSLGGTGHSKKNALVEATIYQRGPAKMQDVRLGPCCLLFRLTKSTSICGRIIEMTFDLLISCFIVLRAERLGLSLFVGYCTIMFALRCRTSPIRFLSDRHGLTTRKLSTGTPPLKLLFLGGDAFSVGVLEPILEARKEGVWSDLLVVTSGEKQVGRGPKGTRRVVRESSEARR
jgi:hypothetical protein